jgi:hypothetical protein
LPAKIQTRCDTEGDNLPEHFEEFAEIHPVQIVKYWRKNAANKLASGNPFDRGRSEIPPFFEKATSDSKESPTRICDNKPLHRKLNRLAPG